MKFQSQEVRYFGVSAYYIKELMVIGTHRLCFWNRKAVLVGIQPWNLYEVKTQALALYIVKI